MKSLKKLFALPTPIELGKSSHNALPLDESWCDGDANYTWEDYDKDVRTRYPVRYFINRTLRDWFVVRIKMRIEHFFYWIKSHTYRRYHLLDLRQVHTDTDDDYEWGWIDPCQQMTLAIWTIFANHIKSLNSSNWHYGANDEGIARLKAYQDSCEHDDEKEGLQIQINYLIEAKELYEYWSVYRKIKLRRKAELLSDWSDHRKKDKKDGNTVRWDKLNEYEKQFDEEQEQMLIRLIKIRDHLWL